MTIEEAERQHRLVISEHLSEALIRQDVFEAIVDVMDKHKVGDKGHIFNMESDPPTFKSYVAMALRPEYAGEVNNRVLQKYYYPWDLWKISKRRAIVSPDELVEVLFSAYL